MGIRLDKGTRICGYEVLSFLGAGGYGDVYLATSPSGEHVALKQMRAGGPGTAHAAEAERLHRLRRLIGLHCPFVCAILDVLEHGDLQYLVMEHVKGESLEEMLKREGRLSLAAAYEVVGHLLQGLAWLHGQDIVHRDIKPGNIMIALAPGGKVMAKIIDIDVALHLALDRLTVGLFGLGTHQYACVEVIRGTGIDARADLYSVGVVLFEAVTGQLAWPEICRDDLVRAICGPDRPSVLDIDPTLPKPLDHYVSRLMALHADDRPASAEQALTELDALHHDVDVVPAGPSRLPSSVPPPPMMKHHVLHPGNVAIRVDTGEFRGLNIVIPEEGICLGRMALNPSDRLISRAHCRAYPHDNAIELRGLRARNGLLLRGGTKRRHGAWLRPGESILIGRTSVTCISAPTMKGTAP